MNLPGTDSGNWQWRYDAATSRPRSPARLRDVTERNGRSVAHRR